jgi:hypothetical protein
MLVKRANINVHANKRAFVPGGTGILPVYQEMTGKMPVPPKLAEISQQTLETKYLAQRLATTDRRGERRSPLGD